LAQAINSLEASINKIGLLINFGTLSLEIKRFYNNKISIKYQSNHLIKIIKVK